MTALTRNTHPGPIAATSRPATAGPIKPGQGGLIWPVNGPITSPFCESRAWESCHPGIDIGVPAGTPEHDDAARRFRALRPTSRTAVFPRVFADRAVAAAATRTFEATFDARGLGSEHPAFWALQELRMAQFAQGLGVHGQASAKRVRQLLAG